MSKYEYYKIALRLIPQDIIASRDKQRNGFLCVKLEKGNYCTVQAGIIENTALK